jgi:hypothetical protein
MTALSIPIETNIPLPSDYEGELPSSILDKARAACKALAALHGDEPNDKPVPEKDANKARDVFEKITKVNRNGPPVTLTTLSSYTNETIRYLDRLLTTYDQEIVDSAVRIRHYVTNRLLAETDDPSPAIRLRALELLGKTKDVGLFTDRIEMSVSNKSDSELEAALKQKLERFMGQAEQIETIDEPVVLDPNTLFKTDTSSAAKQPDT